MITTDLIPVNQSNYQKYLLCVNNMNICWNTGLLISKYAKIIDRETYEEHIERHLAGVAAVSEPIDDFIVNHDFVIDEEQIPKESDDTTDIDEMSLLKANTQTPEYIAISDILTYDKLSEILPKTSDGYMKLIETPTNIEQILNDVYVHFCLSKYEMAKTRLLIKSYGVMREYIEYLVNNIDVKSIKNGIHTRKINIKKCSKYIEDNFYKPQLAYLDNFYNYNHESDGERPFKPFKPSELICVLLSNIDIKSDIYMIIAVYLTLSYAMPDIAAGDVDKSYVKYVIETLSNIL